MTKEQLDNWFTCHAPDSEDLTAYEAVRQSARRFAQTINDACPESADKTAAMRKLREAVMTANAAIACKGK